MLQYYSRRNSGRDVGLLTGCGAGAHGVVLVEDGLLVRDDSARRHIGMGWDGRRGLGNEALTVVLQDALCEAVS